MTRRQILPYALALLVIGGLIVVNVARSVTIITVNSGGNIQTALNSAVCGDIIEIEAGATFQGNFTLANKGCGPSDPITIRSTSYASLPTGRVGPSNATNMPRIRTATTAGVFTAQASAGYWVLDGLELTDNNSGATMTASLLDFGESVQGVNHITIQRCYLHPKETGTDYTRSVVRAMQFGGSYLTFKWNYASGFLGVGADGGGLIASEVLLVVAGDHVDLIDNYLEAWYAQVFTGGGGNTIANTATLTAASTTSAVFSNVTGLAAGVVPRFSLSGTGTLPGGTTTCPSPWASWQCSTLTRTGGSVLVDGTDYSHHIDLTTGGVTSRAKVIAVSGNAITVSWQFSSPPGAATYTWIMFSTAIVDSVVGTTVTFTPYGPNALKQAQEAAAWNAQSLTHTWTMTRNTFHKDFAFGQYAYTNLGNNPKGWMELKDMDGLTMTGNQFTGYPSTLLMNARSDEGRTPWCTMKNISVASNYSHPDHDVNAEREWLIAALDDPDNSSTPGGNVTVNNNLVVNTAQSFQTQAMRNSTVSYNTFIGTGNVNYGSSMIFAITPSENWTYRDNIEGYNVHGIFCNLGALALCFPTNTISNNLIADNSSVSFSSTVWGVGGIITPIPATYDAVGFAPNYCGLAADSDYVGTGTGGSNPGVNCATLQTALGGVVGGRVGGKAVLKGRVVVR